MAFENSDQWQVVNRFTLRDGDRLHTCVPQQIVLTVSNPGARFVVSRDFAIDDEGSSPQTLTKEITCHSSMNDASVTLFSPEAGKLGWCSSFHVRILSGMRARMDQAAKVGQNVGLEYTGFSAREVPAGGLMGPEGGLMTIISNQEYNPPWRGELGLFIPPEQFNPVFDAIANAQRPLMHARIIIRANLFEQETDAALNEGWREYGMMIAPGSPDGGTTAALLDDFEFTLSPTAI